MSETVRVIGDVGDGPDLVYVPGVDGSGALLLQTADALQQEFRLVRLAYASGSLPDVQQGYSEMAADVVRVLDALAIDRAILLAESFGVALAIQTALEYPERVRAMALVNGFVRYPIRWKIAFANAFLPFLPGVFFRLGRHVTIPFGMLAPRRDPLVVRAMIDSVGDYFDAAFLRRMEMIRTLDLRDRVAEVRCPVALFTSANDQVVSSPVAAREMAEQLPDAQLEVIERAGHVILPFTDEPWTERMLALAARADGACPAVP